ncbi:hypothetical protein B0T20DRAFT_477318 [Sordaria brevicollis]|uniref:Uncharacterized protein n=1 Tax=Sordaria brevicollis TaxID=83679 RepID=A0AAE0PJJ3_SORBR|nr:hypothetical protein B0T20DRAFT_477318 [Sordaria brevicollis]
MRTGRSSEGVEWARASVLFLYIAAALSSLPAACIAESEAIQAQPYLRSSDASMRPYTP